MHKILGLLLIVSVFIFTACGSVPQVIDIHSTPTGAIVEVNEEGIGRTPCSYPVPDYLDYYASLKFRVRKPGYEADMKSVQRDPNGNYPKRLDFMLEASIKPPVSAPSAPAAGGVGGQFGQQATPTVNTPMMMGPTTIVVPSGPTYQSGPTQQSNGENQ